MSVSKQLADFVFVAGTSPSVDRLVCGRRHYADFFPVNLLTTGLNGH